MKYIVFHAMIDTTENDAYLEFFIRHTERTAISSEAKKQRVNLCFKTAIERRASGGIRLELCNDDKPGLLAEVTRAFRENVLNVTRAEISMTKGKAENIFYLTDAHGNHVDSKNIESVRQRIRLDYLRVKELPLAFRNNEKGGNVKGGAVLLHPQRSSCLLKNNYSV
ncbi:putative ACT domain-containing protein ACR1-12 [Helianthus annuus]|uniref:ACT domain-containing protein ACR n=1 Tax=Helianthus annuus TaxID=4232 RepID=A0A9K3J1H5_HELAN|nr:ACT domain-containing protein ACR8-like [Helianthus annuus]XP_035846637.1 ACT domain-containing protein ACR8-like [Helianthus annuus]KAF5806612.1 putative ACT domain-containing protein ACR1-12 [Helianthus annuus]KAJ0585208.1 putative ACT domain-containing protein ACR1-12 [Helianthus annuus]KAJ0919693.1 putative ACT domain-containing protein ACR1-12 [Helianthus annuus]KAJ0923430.1 putative ACT domain-containing protein ACR1-12 [Helianthus annuus]